MTTAPAELPAELRVVASIRALKAVRKIGTDTLAAHIGVSRSTWYDKMRTGQFTVGEVISLAQVFDVSVQSLVDGQPQLANVPPFLHSIDGGGAHTPGINRPLLATARLSN